MKGKLTIINRIRFKIGSWFIDTGLSMAARSYRCFQGNIRELADPVVGKVPKYNKRVESDNLNFDTPDALENEVISIMATTAKGDFNSSDYPQIRNVESNLKHYGIKSHNRLVALFQVVYVSIKDAFESRNSNNLNDAVTTEKLARLTANQIARKYGYNKGRRRNPEKQGKNDKYQADFVNREIRSDSQQYDSFVLNNTDRVEYKLLLQQYMHIFKRMDERDKLVSRTQALANIQNISFEEAYRHYETEFNKVGITTSRGAKKRYLSLENRYEELKPIKEVLKN